MSITVKGIREGLLTTLPSDKDWLSLMDDLSGYIDERGAFFKGARLVLDLNGRAVSSDDIQQLQALLAERDVDLLVVLSDNEVTRTATEALNIYTELSQIPDVVVRASELDDDDDLPEPMDSEEYGTVGVLVKRTLRNGRTVRSRGHVVVIGDVNHGAEIVATGDVIVWGKLRGVVHAGSEGDESAVVCALDLAPMQLRIASLISIPPQEKRRNPRPEMAQVKDGQIEAVPWSV
jgi:septum site-determining protein MinC